MRNLLASIIFSLLSISLNAQGCLPNGILFTTQAQIDNFQTNYPGCTEIEGDVNISGYDSDITNLNGLDVLTSIGGNLEIHDCQSLNNLQGLHNVQSIGGYLFLGGNTLSNLNGLESLSTILGSFAVGEDEYLYNLSGLDNLETIGGTVYFGGMTMGGPACTNLVNLNGIENLNSIGGDLRFFCNYLLEDLTGLSGLTNIGGELEINGNPELQSLSGLENIESSTILNMTISYNPLLSQCEVQSICDYLANPNGYIIIHDNAPNCNGQFEIELACAIASIDEVSNIEDNTSSPNPFTSSTTLSYSLKQPSTVQFSIYNQLGQLVYQYSEEQQQGEQQLIWNAEGCAEGVYYYRLKEGDAVANGKMVKVK